MTNIVEEKTETNIVVSEHVTNEENRTSITDRNEQVEVTDVEEVTSVNTIDSEYTPEKELAEYLEIEKNPDRFIDLHNYKHDVKVERIFRTIESLKIKPAFVPTYKSQVINDLIENHEETCKKINGDDILNEFVEEAKQIKIDEKKHYYKQGFLFEKATNVPPCIMDTDWRRGHDVFAGLTRKEIEERIIYYKYVSVITDQGRSIEDIYEIDVKKIYEIYYLYDETKYEEFENFLKANKVSRAEIKRAVYLMNTVENLSIEKAVEQAKKETKAKKDDIKSGTALERKHKLLKKRFTALNECFARSSEKYIDGEKTRRKLQLTTNKQAKEIDDLKAKVKNYKKDFRHLQRLVNKNVQNNEIVEELKTIISKNNNSTIENQEMKTLGNDHISNLNIEQTVIYQEDESSTSTNPPDEIK